MSENWPEFDRSQIQSQNLVQSYFSVQRLQDGITIAATVHQGELNHLSLQVSSHVEN